MVLPLEIRDPTHRRCDCGSLIAIIDEGRIEIKCRRCRRIVPIHFREMISRRLLSALFHKRTSLGRLEK